MHEERPDLRLNTILSKKVRPDIYVPSGAEIQRLMAYTSEKEILIPIMLAAYCGMRRGEIAALQADDIKSSMIHVHKTMVETPSHTWQIKAPKSYARDRFVPAPKFVIDALPPNGNVTELNPTMIS
jgi:integrase